MMQQGKAFSLVNQGALSVHLFYTPASTCVEVLLLRLVRVSIAAATVAHQEMPPWSPISARPLCKACVWSQKDEPTE